MPIHTLNIDLETRSGADIRKSGVYRYAEDPEFEILLFGVSVDQGPVAVYDLARGESIPESILEALAGNETIKYAYNASFERVCLSYWLRKHRPEIIGNRKYLDPASWRCTMVLAAYNGLPPGLENAGAVLNLDRQKMKEGKDLIRCFCSPCRPTAANGFRTWNLPEHAPEKWQLFKQYNRRDVEVEMRIQEDLRGYPVPEEIWKEYAMDQEINDRGIRIDLPLVKSAIRLDEQSRKELTGKLQEKTGLENPNSVVQMKDFLKRNGIETETIGKKEVAEMLKDAPPEMREVLSLRLQLAKSSVKKYEAMKNAVCRDGRCRGMFQFYGASRTGRWAGRLIQMQNLPQNKMPDLEQARELARQEDGEMLSLLYPGIPQVLSELIRTAFIPEDGMKFIVADYSAIEARMIAYLANEAWRTETFRKGGDIYCASAEKMFHVPVEKHGINGHLRQKGKIAELALGYGGGTGALKSMGALEMGLKEEELQPLVTAWREASPNIVRFWWDIDAAVKSAVRTHTEQNVGNIRIRANTARLTITLPSGRQLIYRDPRIEENRFGGSSVTYMGIDPNKKWTRIESYGPKFVENIVQAISRDVLAHAMRNLAKNQFRIVGHIHDEVIIEAKEDTPIEAICTEMQKTPGWLPGIDLKADGYECGFYMKA